MKFAQFGIATKMITKKGTKGVNLVLDPRISKLLPSHAFENEIYLFEGPTEGIYSVCAAMPDDYVYQPGKTRAQKSAEYRASGKDGA